MPLQFEVTVPYGDTSLTVRADDFKSLHEAAARLHELNRDAVFLRNRSEGGIVPDHHKDGSENDYYGFRNPRTGANVTFGQMKDKAAAVPFFPKGQDGYWEPDPSTSNGAPAQPVERTGEVRLNPHQAAAARALKDAGLDRGAAVQLLGTFGAERVSELSDVDAIALVAELKSVA